MRKAIADARAHTYPLTAARLDTLRSRGFKFVQVKGITADNHYDYTEPSRLILVPMRELPADDEKRDIYEPIESELLLEWARHPDEGARVFVTGAGRSKDASVSA